MNTNFLGFGLTGPWIDPEPAIELMVWRFCDDHSYCEIVYYFSRL